MSGRTRVLVTIGAIGAGAALGATALVAFRAARRPGVTATAPAVAPVTPTAPATLATPAASPSVGVAAGSAVAAATAAAAAPDARRHADRFAEDPAVSAACPADMALVEGDFCPALAYRCARPGEEQGFGCAEYARGERCREPTDFRRFCVDRHEWPNRVGELPRVHVDWNEAKALCASVGKRLCRRSEWTLACEGPKRLPYPWGFVRAPSPCNIDRASIPADAIALLHEATREEELSRLWQADPIGSHPDCISAFGAYDMAGNVDEWTDNLADDPSTPHPSTLNGGYWGPVRNTCRLTTPGHSPIFKFYQVGFRCCADTIDGVPVPPPRPFIERPEPDRSHD